MLGVRATRWRGGEIEGRVREGREEQRRVRCEGEGHSSVECVCSQVRCKDLQSTSLGPVPLVKQPLHPVQMLGGRRERREGRNSQMVVQQTVLQTCPLLLSPPRMQTMPKHTHISCSQNWCSPACSLRRTMKEMAVLNAA